MLHAMFLYAMLADPEFQVRESAQSRLLHFVDRHPTIYGPRLAEWARSATCPETRRRASFMLVAYERWRVNSFVPSSVPVWPCCDCLPLANPFVPFCLAPDLRDRCTGQTWLPIRPPFHGSEAAPYWSRFRLGTEAMIRAKLRDGYSPEECDRLLLRMWAVERSVRSDCGDRWIESEKWKRWAGGYPRP